MKKLLSVCALTLSCAFAFAQDGYFVKAGFGAGTSTSSFSVFAGDAYKNNMAVLSAQGQLGIGYNCGNWQLETGLGYMRTGVSFVAANGIPLCGIGPNTNPVPETAFAVKYTITNTHLTVPVMISYALHSGRKLSISPGAGVEAMYNFKGKMTTKADVEPALYGERYNYNNFGAAIVVKCDVQYRLCEHMSVWVSPSYQNMMSSLTTKVPGEMMSRTYDRAFVFSTGVRYNLHSVHKVSATVN